MSDLRQVFAAILPLLVSLGILVLGNGLFSTLLAVRMGAESFPVDRIGIIMAAYSVGFVLGTLRCPRVVERVGHIRAFAAFAALAAISALVHAIVVDQIVWLLLRVVAGFCLAGLFTITESWINASSSNTVRGRVLSVYMTVNYLSLGASQSLITVIDPNGFQIFSLVAILVALSLVPLALSRVQSPGSVGTNRLRVIEIVRISPLGVAGCIGAGLINGAFGSMGPVYVQARGGTVEDVGLFMMVAILSGFLMQFPMGRLSDRFDRRTVFLGAIAGVSAAAVALAFADDVPNLAFAAMLGLYGGLAYSIYPIALAHANDFMSSDEVVPASAGLLLMFGVGSVVGPVLASQVMGLLGFNGLFFYIGSIAGVLVLFTLYRMTARQAKPLEEQGAFVPMPQTATTPIALELNPRAEAAGQEADQLAFDFDPPDRMQAQAAE
ncbi:MFS transporter [Skermanella rosea]|uniref:MFS transporter n=1 Tax=Skermanella rosea TaxID=1817965 RepID=UPI001932A74D|nr:MFS transporter [Skermanella rosea]UEM02932.1 MFS transporter [Skermanella rosea]